MSTATRQLRSLWYDWLLSLSKAFVAGSERVAEVLIRSALRRISRECESPDAGHRGG
jgi:hypothetical protein